MLIVSIATAYDIFMRVLPHLTSVYSNKIENENTLIISEEQLKSKRKYE